jgi:hypothetical protein
MSPPLIWRHDLSNSKVFVWAASDDVQTFYSEFSDHCLETFAAAQIEVTESGAK